MKRNILLIVCFAVFLSSADLIVRAQIVVEKSGGAKTSIDLSGMKTTGGKWAGEFRKVLESDLVRSGWFSIMPAGQGGIVIAGSCAESGGRINVNCLVSNRASGKNLMRESYDDAASEARTLAHRVADDILLAVRNIKGMASCRIVMIGSSSKGADIYVCDSDGGNMIRLTRNESPCLSPSWGPDGKTVVHTSFHGGFPDIYKIDLNINKMTKLAGFPGLNSGADISPNGKEVCLTLSKDGNPDIYIMSMRGGRLKRLTSTPHAAEASPSWSPDGRELVFVSDQTRQPQLYIISAGGGNPRRISRRGSENVAPDWGPDGRIAFSSRRGGCYQICVLDPSTSQEIQVTGDGADYEDPSWAPDGRHIVCSRTVNYRSELCIVDTLGDELIRLTPAGGDWYSPSCSWK